MVVSGIILVLICFVGATYYLVDMTPSGNVNPFYKVGIYNDDGQLTGVIDPIKKEVRTPNKAEELFFMAKSNYLFGRK